MQWVKAAAMVSVNLTICILVGVRIGVRYRRGSARKRSCTSVGLSSFTMHAVDLYEDPKDSKSVLSVPAKMLL